MSKKANRSDAATLRGTRARLREAWEREAALKDAVVKAIDVLDDMRLDAYERERRAAAILEAAIGREPRGLNGNDAGV